jgi:S1-C subfamily serine protease
MSGTNNLLGKLSDSLAEAVAKAGLSTVMVEARRRMPASGVVFKPDLVLSANHVVERDDDIRLLFPDGKDSSARVVGRDPGSDLVLLQVPVGGLSPAERAPETALVGQLALALGRPSPEGIQASLGIISASGGPLRTGRGGILESYLRTDTIPYPGFSGGPLVDAGGFVIGINTSGLTRFSSIAIPAALAWGIAEALESHGGVPRGYLGIRSQPVSIPAQQREALGRQQENGLLLVGVEEHSPAERGGLMVGDILVAMAGKPVNDPDELLTMLVGATVGQPAVLQVLRGGESLEIQIEIGERK